MNTIEDVYIFVMNNTSSQQFVLFCLAFLFLVEEVFIRFMGLYPYKYGLAVKRIVLNAKQELALSAESSKLRKATVKTRSKRGEVYLRFKYSYLAVGPVVFVGQISSQDKNVLNVRIGIGTATFFVYMFLYPFLTKAIDLYDVANALIVPGFLYWFYLHLLACIPKSKDGR